VDGVKVMRVNLTKLISGKRFWVNYIQSLPTPNLHPFPVFIPKAGGLRVGLSIRTGARAPFFMRDISFTIFRKKIQHVNPVATKI